MALLFLLRLQSRHYLPDVVLERLLKSLIGRFSNFFCSIAEHIPTSVPTLRKHVGYSENFKKFAVCANCFSIYELGDCIARPGVSKVFMHKESPYCRPCNMLLLKTVELAGGKKILYPLKVYCYHSLQDHLQTLLSKPDFGKLVNSGVHAVAQPSMRICMMVGYERNL